MPRTRKPISSSQYIQEQKHESTQQKRNLSYNNPGYTREEERFRDSVNYNDRIANKRSNASYSREERAFNKGRNADYDQQTAHRLQNQRYIDKAHNALSKDVPSRNPTSSGDGSREWADHKYIDKVQTKTGKTRYIYDITTSSGTHNPNTKPISSNDLKRAKQSITNPTNPRAIAQESARKATTRNTGGSDTMYSPVERAVKNVTETARKAAYNVSKAASDGAKFVQNVLSDAIANTSLKDLFK